MQRNMRESSKQIECIRIVKLHEKKGEKQAKEDEKNRIPSHR